MAEGRRTASLEIVGRRLLWHGAVFAAALIVGACGSSTSAGAIIGPTPSAVTAAAPGALSSLGTMTGTVASGRILFGIERDQSIVGLASIDATGFHEIDTHGTVAANAIWAPNDRIFFDSEQEKGVRRLSELTLSDGTIRQITDDPRTGEEKAAISEDGSRLAYEHYVGGTNVDLGIQVRSLADGSTISMPVLDDPKRGGDTEAALSPDGRTLAFIRVLDWDVHKAALYVVDVAGGTPRRLTSDAFDAGHPRWSPDGRSILITQGLHGGPHDGPIYLVPADGGDPRPLTAHGAGQWVFEGDWSPDGRQIVFKYYEDGWDHNELRTASADGSDERSLWIGDRATAETPDWAP